MYYIVRPDERPDGYVNRGSRLSAFVVCSFQMRASFGTGPNRRTSPPSASAMLAGNGATPTPERVDWIKPSTLFARATIRASGASSRSHATTWCREGLTSKVTRS